MSSSTTKRPSMILAVLTTTHECTAHHSAVCRWTILFVCDRLVVRRDRQPQPNIPLRSFFALIRVARTSHIFGGAVGGDLIRHRLMLLDANVCVL